MDRGRTCARSASAGGHEYVAVQEKPREVAGSYGDMDGLRSASTEGLRANHRILFHLQGLRTLLQVSLPLAPDARSMVDTADSDSSFLRRVRA